MSLSLRKVGTYGNRLKGLLGEYQFTKHLDTQLTNLIISINQDIIRNRIGRGAVNAKKEIDQQTRFGKDKPNLYDYKIE